MCQHVLLTIGWMDAFEVDGGTAFFLAFGVRFRDQVILLAAFEGSGPSTQLGPQARAGWCCSALCVFLRIAEVIGAHTKLAFEFTVDRALSALRLLLVFEADWDCARFDDGTCHASIDYPSLRRRRQARGKLMRTCATAIKARGAIQEHYWHTRCHASRRRFAPVFWVCCRLKKYVEIIEQGQGKP